MSTSRARGSAGHAHVQREPAQHHRQHRERRGLAAGGTTQGPGGQLEQRAPAALAQDALGCGQRPEEGRTQEERGQERRALDALGHAAAHHERRRARADSRPGPQPPQPSIPFHGGIVRGRVASPHAPRRACPPGHPASGSPDDRSRGVCPAVPVGRRALSASVSTWCRAVRIRTASPRGERRARRGAAPPREGGGRRRRRAGVGRCVARGRERIRGRRVRPRRRRSHGAVDGASAEIDDRTTWPHASRRRWRASNRRGRG